MPIIPLQAEAYFANFPNNRKSFAFCKLYFASATILLRGMSSFFIFDHKETL